MTNVRISADALADLDDAFWFYEAQEPGLGDYFAIQLRATETNPMSVLRKKPRSRK